MNTQTTEVWIFPCGDALDPISFSDAQKFAYNDELVIFGDLTPAEEYEEGWSCSSHVSVELTRSSFAWQPFSGFQRFLEACFSSRGSPLPYLRSCSSFQKLVSDLFLTHPLLTTVLLLLLYSLYSIYSAYVAVVYVHDILQLASVMCLLHVTCTLHLFVHYRTGSVFRLK